MCKHTRMDYLYSGLRTLRKVGNTLLGVEGFEEDASGNVVVNTQELAKVLGLLSLYVFLGIVLSILVAFGAARQSYCYNIYIGNDQGVAILFAVLCFFFPHFYYPFYALFLNPVCDLGRKNKGVLGGLIGGRRSHRG
jgi:hypothetical protein